MYNVLILKVLFIDLDNNKQVKNITMLGLSKKVLKGVSFDKHLFSKELRKSISYIQKEDLSKFYTWCLASFAMYNEVIIEAFETV